jgi:hypothetical protein
MIVCCVFVATIATEKVQDEAGGSFVLEVLAGFMSPLGGVIEVLAVLDSDRRAGWYKVGVVVRVGG